MRGVTNRQPDLRNRYQVSLAMSPDGQHAVATYNDNTAWMWDFNTGLVQHELHDHTALIFRTAFSPDSRTLATAGTDQVIGLWDVESGAHLGLLQGHQAAVTALAFFADGHRLVSGSRDRTVRVWDIGTTHRSPDITMDLPGGTDISIASDGSLIWQGGAGRPWTVTDSVTDSVISPDGIHLAVVGHDGVTGIWDLQNPEKPPRMLASPETGIWSACFFPDGERLAVGLDSGEIVLWDVVAGREVVRLLEDPLPSVAMAFNPEFDALVTVSLRSVRVWRGGERGR